MESSRKLFSAILVLMLLLVATDEMGGPVVVVEAKMCLSPSGKFKGPCVISSVCNKVCKKEGFQNGECHGTEFLGRCWCIKQCVH